MTTQRLAVRRTDPGLKALYSNNFEQIVQTEQTGKGIFFKGKKKRKCFFIKRKAAVIISSLLVPRGKKKKKRKKTGGNGNITTGNSHEGEASYGGPGQRKCFIVQFRNP